MPSDWIQRKAENERTEAANTARERDLQLRNAEMIRALGPAFVKNLMNVLNEDITAWNAAFKDRQINGAMGIQNGFNLSKIGFPRGSADITFNPSALRIDVNLQRSTAQGDGMYETEGFMYLEVNPDGKGIHMLDRTRRGHIEPAGFSRMILESIAEPMSNHLF